MRPRRLLKFFCFLFPGAGLLTAQDASLELLYNGNIYLQDPFAKQLFIPVADNQKEEKVIERAQEFWENLENGLLKPDLIHQDNLIPIEEQVTTLLGISIKTDVSPSPPNGEKSSRPGDDQVPLRIKQIRFSHPVIENNTARLRTRLKLDANISQSRTFLNAEIYFVHSGENWLIEILRMASERIPTYNESMDVYAKESYNHSIEPFLRGY